MLFFTTLYAFLSVLIFDQVIATITTSNIGTLNFQPGMAVRLYKTSLTGDETYTERQAYLEKLQYLTDGELLAQKAGSNIFTSNRIKYLMNEVFGFYISPDDHDMVVEFRGFFKPPKTGSLRLNSALSPTRDCDKEYAFQMETDYWVWRQNIFLNQTDQGVLCTWNNSVNWAYLEATKVNELQVRSSGFSSGKFLSSGYYYEGSYYQIRMGVLVNGDAFNNVFTFTIGDTTYQFSDKYFYYEPNEDFITNDGNRNNVFPSNCPVFDDETLVDSEIVPPTTVYPNQCPVTSSSTSEIESSSTDEMSSTIETSFEPSSVVTSSVSEVVSTSDVYTSDPVTSDFSTSEIYSSDSLSSDTSTTDTESSAPSVTSSITHSSSSYESSTSEADSSIEASSTNYITTDLETSTIISSMDITSTTMSTTDSLASGTSSLATDPLSSITSETSFSSLTVTTSEASMHSNEESYSSELTIQSSTTADPAVSVSSMNPGDCISTTASSISTSSSGITEDKAFDQTSFITTMTKSVTTTTFNAMDKSSKDPIDVSRSSSPLVLETTVQMDGTTITRTATVSNTVDKSNDKDTWLHDSTTTLYSDNDDSQTATLAGPCETGCETCISSVITPPPSTSISLDNFEGQAARVSLEPIIIGLLLIIGIM
ncbi:hypothetical protein, no similarity [Maudiozyma saulgeensis]|uniref:Flo11 domain-containing protein n=1 Tax=Maudiozyma saulgeensis TaxID=1789683 RepID=A0A1X7RB97_9SACH|nr:hypothetical protein, no similarity [Kazachstania saulgeensis]